MAAQNLTRSSTRVTIPTGQANLGSFDEDLYETGAGNPAVKGLSFMPSWDNPNPNRMTVQRFQLQGVLAYLLEHALQ